MHVRSKEWFICLARYSFNGKLGFLSGVKDLNYLLTQAA